MLFLCNNWEIEYILKGQPAAVLAYYPVSTHPYQEAELKSNGILHVIIYALKGDFIAQEYNIKWDHLPLDVRSALIAL